MPNNDIRITGWDLPASAGMTYELVFNSNEALTSLALYVGGTLTDVNDLTDATAYNAVLSGGNLVATVDLDVPTGKAVPLRLVVDGAVVTTGHLRPSPAGAKTLGDGNFTINTGSISIAMSVLGVLTAGGHPDLAAHNTLGLATQAELDAEATARANADTAHEADTTAVHGIPDTSALLDTGDVGTTVQPADADLTTIAGLDSSTAGAMATDGAGWVRKTYAQLKTALGLVKADVGLGNVDNTSDANKPVSTAQQTALDAKAPLASPNLTGTPTAPTAAAGTNTTQLATTAFVGTAVVYPTFASLNAVSTPPHATIGPAWTVYHDSSFVGDGHRYSDGTANSRAISYDLLLAAGTYTFALLHRAEGNRGIYTVIFDDVTVGTIDGYSAGTVTTFSEITGITVATPGLKRLTLSMQTKNASSSAYYGSIAHIAMTRTGA